MKAGFRIILAMILISLMIIPMTVAQEENKEGQVAIIDLSGGASISRAGSPPKIDGVVDQNETWNDATLIGIPYGNMWVQNDDYHLYMLLDIFCDTHNDFRKDSVSILFDLDKNGRPSPDDLLYKIKYKELVMGDYGKSNFKRILPIGLGFGPSIMKGYESPKHKFPHRVIELAIKLQEVGIKAGEKVRIGVKITSQNPAFSFNTTPSFSTMVEFTTTAPAPLFAPGEVLVKFAKGVSKEEISNIEKEYNLRRLSKLLSIYRYKIPSDKTVPGMVKLLEENPRIESATPNFIFNPGMLLQQITNITPDWIETSELASTTPEYENSRSVALLQISENKSCTGFMVGPNILVTANHCVSTNQEARGVKAIFNWEKGVPETQRETYICDELIRTWSTQDVTLLRCRPGPIGAKQSVLPGARWGQLTLCDKLVNSRGPIYVIHQNDQNRLNHNKKISFGVVANPDWKENQFTHDADTLRGSSGAPIFDPESHNVVAFHRGYTKKENLNIAISVAELTRELKKEGLWSSISHCKR